MIPAAKKSLIAGVVLLVAGAIVVSYGAQAFTALANFAGATAEPGLHVVSLILAIVRLGLMPLGAALVGAAIVIQTIVPLLPVREQQHAPDPQQTD